MGTDEIKNEIYQIKKYKEKIKREDLKYQTKKDTYDFQQYETVRSFGESIYTRKASIVEVEEDQTNLLENLVEFGNKSRLKQRGYNKKEILMKVHMLFMDINSLWILTKCILTLNAFKSGIFPI